MRLAEVFGGAGTISLDMYGSDKIYYVNYEQALPEAVPPCVWASKSTSPQLLRSP